MKIRNILIGSILTMSTFAAFAESSQQAQTPVSPQATQTQPSSSSFNPEQIKEIQQIIHSYLVKNPQVLLEASQALQAQAIAKAQKTAHLAIIKNKEKLFNDPSSPVAGNANGNIILVEFFDYQCGHCKTMNLVIQSVLKENKNLKVVFKELPIFGSESNFAAKAALASAKQNKYFQFHDALLAAENPLSNAKVLKIAQRIGLNINQLQKDMKLPEINQQLRENFQLAQNLQLMGTPAFVISNQPLTDFKFIPGATSQQDLQQQINSIKTN